MKRHWFYILLSVSASARYGAAIQEDVRALSGGSIRLWPATLYGSLEELSALGWIEEVAEDARPGLVAGRERFYQLTDVGRDALETETERIEGLARVARSRLRGSEA